MNTPDDLVEFNVPSHYDESELPCFACWLESMLQAAGDVYDSDGQEGYEAAILGALRQIAESLGALLAVLTPPASQQELHDLFIARIGSSMRLHAVDATGVQH